MSFDPLKELDERTLKLARAVVAMVAAEFKFVVETKIDDGCVQSIVRMEKR